MPGIVEFYAGAANRYVQSCVDKGKIEKIARADVDALVIKALDLSDLDLSYKLVWYHAVLYSDALNSLWIGLKQLHNLSDEAIQPYQLDHNLISYVVPSDYSSDEDAATPPSKTRKRQASRSKIPNAKKPKTTTTRAHRVSFNPEPEDLLSTPSSSPIKRTPRRSILKRNPLITTTNTTATATGATKAAPTPIAKAPRKQPTTSTPRNRARPTKDSAKVRDQDADAADKELLATRVTEDTMRQRPTQGTMQSQGPFSTYSNEDVGVFLRGDANDEANSSMSTASGVMSIRAGEGYAGMSAGNVEPGVSEEAGNAGLGAMDSGIVEVSDGVVEGIAGMTPEQVVEFNRNLDSLFEE